MQLHKLACCYMSLHAVTQAYMQLHKLACSYMSLHAVTLACMQLHELAYSSMILHAVPRACMQFIYLSEQLTRISQCLFFYSLSQKFSYGNSDPDFVLRTLNFGLMIQGCILYYELRHILF